MMRHVLLALSLMLYVPHSFAICSSQIQSNTPNSRYQIFNNGSEVKDLKTELIWQRCTVGQTWTGSSCEGEATAYTWPQALEIVKTGDNIWRLPNVKELYSLVNIACYNPSINEPIFPNTANDGYWSSSPFVSQSIADHAWSVIFGSRFIKDVNGSVEVLSTDTLFMLRLVKDNNSK